MKKAINKNSATTLLVFVSLLTFFSSCEPEENLTPIKGKVTFSLSERARDNGRVTETPTPAFVLLSVKDSNGKTEENIKLPLYNLGAGYISENLELEKGNYQLTQFAVVNAANKIIYAAPLEQSELAKYVAIPLPIDFTIAEDKSTSIVPEVLAVMEDDTPEKFGYATFSYEVVSSNHLVLIKTSVKILVGKILYENLDALIRVNGYSADNKRLWTKEYNFIGPEDNILEVKNGFHHYSVELVDKWGINDNLSYISAAHIWDGRADGPHPGTIALGGSKKAKKLLMTVESVQLNTPGNITYPPAFRRLYTYDNDERLARIRYETYNAQTSQFEETQIDNFTYTGTSLSTIRKSLGGTPHHEYHYEYGLQNKINQVTPAGVTEWTATFTDNSYNDPTNNTITVEYYYHPKAQSFFYEFNVRDNNRVSHKDLEFGGSGRICNEGTYTYDKYINPFQHFGYVDFNITNWSINNKLTENINYLACWFPANRIPVSYAYTYDQDGYPVKQMITYKSGTFDKTPPYRSQVDFYYE